VIGIASISRVGANVVMHDNTMNVSMQGCRYGHVEPLRNVFPSRGALGVAMSR